MDEVRRCASACKRFVHGRSRVSLKAVFALGALVVLAVLGSGSAYALRGNSGGGIGARAMTAPSPGTSTTTSLPAPPPPSGHRRPGPTSSASPNSPSLGAVSGTIYPNPSNSGAFDTSQLATPSFSQAFQLVNFNNASSAFCTNNTGVTNNTVPFTEVTENADGSCGTVPVQGNGLQAGSGTLDFFEGSFTSVLTIPTAGQITFDFLVDDGWIFGSGPVSGGSSQPTYVSGSLTNAPSTSAVKGYTVVGAFNQQSSPASRSVTVNFPVAGTYPIEIDYTECCTHPLELSFDDSTGLPIPSNQGGGSGSGPSTGEQGGPPNPGENPVGISCGAPVNCATGVFWHKWDDLHVPGRGVSLDFQRTYSSAAAGTDGPLGFGWTDSYNMSLAVDPSSGDVTVSQEDGARVSFAPNGSGGYAPAKPWVLASLVKNGDGTYTFTRNGDLIHYTFSAAGQLVKEVDRNGYTTSLSYNGSGQLATVTDPAGRAFTFAYNGSHIASVTGPGPRQESFTYDASGNLQTATDPANGMWQFGYDANHRMVSMTDPRNDGSLTTHYNAAGQVDSQTDMLGTRTTHWSYTGDPTSAAGGTTTVTDPNGNVATFTFQNLELVSKTEGVGTSVAATTAYQYDPATLGITQITDPNGNISNATYDANGNQLTYTDGLHRQTIATYNSLNEPLTVKDPSGVTTTRTYDGSGNLLTISRPLNSNTNQVVTYHYDDAGHPGDVTSITEPNGHTTTFTYDSQGDLASVTDPLGDKTTFVYDVLGERTSMVSPRGNVSGGTPSQYTTSYLYDPLGRLKQTTDPLSHTSKQTYDPDGNLLTSNDGDNNLTQYSYDADNELTQITRADTTTLKYGYDGDGNPTSQTDGNNQPTTYTYDPLDRVSTVTDPLHRTTTYGYDLNGNRTILKDPAGNTATYGYDAANELQSISYSDGKTPNVSFAYTPNGLRQTMADGTGTTTYSYDQLNRLTGQSNPTSGQSVGYGYDLASNLTSIAYPNGKTVTRGYDNANRLTSIADWLGHTSTLTPDPDSNTTAIGYANGITATNSFDAADQLSSITDKNSGGTTIASFTYTRDSNGQLLTTTPTGTGQGSSETYTYTKLNQLATLNSSSYTYDTADNITKLANGATLAYDTANEATTFTPSGGTATTPTYDTRGNRLTGPGGATYTYDQANRITASSGGPGSVISVAAGSSGTSLAQTRSGTVWAWGYNGDGELGNGTTTNSSVPIRASITGVTNIAEGGDFSLAAKSDGTAWAWGNNSNGQLGNGTTTNSSLPVQVNSLTAVSAVAAGAETGYALKSNGTVWAWGDNFYGELGNGTNTSSTVPVQVSGLTGVTAISSGWFHGLALKADGTVWAWGLNQDGELGNHSTKNSNTPVQVKNLTGITAVAGGNGFSLALKSDGTVWAWGNNTTGDLGNGTTTGSSIPVEVSNLTGATHIAAGEAWSLAAKSDGTAWAWGDNGQGELGNGTTTSSDVPVEVSTLANVTALAAGGNQSLAGKADGTAWAWGGNAVGQLGNGTTNPSKVPVQVSTLAQATFTYDGDGLRATATNGSTTQHFAWDLSGSLPLLLTDGSTNYIYDDTSTPVEQIDSAGNPLYYQHDQLGSTRLLTTQTGTTAATYTYDPYGNLTNQTGTADTPLRWAGQYQDTATGLYYLRTRYYDPQTSQFLGRDPVAALTQQAYSYGAGSPLSVVDPAGLGANCSQGGGSVSCPSSYQFVPYADITQIVFRVVARTPATITYFFEWRTATAYRDNAIGTLIGISGLRVDGSYGQIGFNTSFDRLGRRASQVKPWYAHTTFIALRGTSITIQGLMEINDQRGLGLLELTRTCVVP